MRGLYIIGDSLALARPKSLKDSAVNYGDTYVAHIRKHYEGSGVHVHHNGRRERTIDEVYALTDEIIWTGADVALIQVGIVDCAPRVFSRWQRAFVARLPKCIRVPILIAVNKLKLPLLKLRPWVVYTSVKQFETHLEKIITKLNSNEVKVILCGIAPAGQGMRSRNPRLQKQIQKYNDTMSAVVGNHGGTMVSMEEVFHDQIENCLLSDGHHFSELGHQQLTDVLLEDYLI